MESNSHVLFPLYLKNLDFNFNFPSMALFGHYVNSNFRILQNDIRLTPNEIYFVRIIFHFFPWKLYNQKLRTKKIVGRPRDGCKHYNSITHLALPDVKFVLINLVDYWRRRMNNEHGVKQMLGASYIAANLYCICVTTCFMFAKADAVYRFAVILERRILKHCIT